MTPSRPWGGPAAATIALLFALLAPLAQAQSTTSASGTYMVEGGSYMITVRQDADTLVVVEPNKESPYARQADGSYAFYNPNTDTNYGIRIIEDLRADDEMRAIPIVLCTGAAEAVHSLRPRLDALGVPIVVKPFSLEELERALERALERTARAE